MLTILIIEDNPEEMNYCTNIIHSLLDDCLILQAENAEKALYFLQCNNVDIFFIDVELPGMNGFQFAEEIRRNPHYIMTIIVFITGYKANQLDIHRKYHHYEYIEKPYSMDSFKRRVDPIFKGLCLQKSQNKCSQFVNKRKMVLIETNEETLFIAFDDILYVETECRRLTLYTRHNTYRDINAKMDDFIKDVNSFDFIRCHKSFAVNVNNILTIKNASRRLWHAYFNENENYCCMISQTFYEKTHNQYLKLKER